jgi:hypothetical protein
VGVGGKSRLNVVDEWETGLRLDDFEGLDYLLVFVSAVIH